jgi:Rrf2 family protein
MAAIAENHGISRKYLHAILTLLKSAGYIRSVRGTGGGYVLTRDPSDVTVVEIVEALEGPLAITECVNEEMTCDRSEDCVTRVVWRELSEAVRQVLSGITLEELARRSRESRRNRPPMYHI